MCVCFCIEQIQVDFQNRELINYEVENDSKKKIWKE